MEIVVPGLEPPAGIASACAMPHRQFVGHVCSAVALTRTAIPSVFGRPGGRVSYLEVGVRDGDSFEAAWRGAGDFGHVALVDDWGRNHGGTGRGSHDHIAAMVTRLQAEGLTVGTIEYLDMDSRQALPRLWDVARRADIGRRDNPHVFDVVHIDADHSYEGALADIVGGWTLTRHALVVHDLFMPSVAAALRAFATDVEHRDAIRDIDASLIDSGTVCFWRQGGDR